MTTTSVSTTKALVVAGVGPVQLTVEDRGQGRNFLVLHGGAGPQSVAAFAQLAAKNGRHRVLMPIHPGFSGTTRPNGLNDLGALAALYSALLDELGLEEVTVIGNSVGGWIAAELALFGFSADKRFGPHRCGGYRSVGPRCHRRFGSFVVRDSGTLLPRPSTIPH